MKNFQNRKYQTESVEAGVNFMLNDKSTTKGVILSPVGSGKSLIIGQIVKRLNAPTIVLQPSKELLEQNKAKFTFFGGEASVYSASMGIKEIGEVTYATLGSIKKIAAEFKKKGVKYVLVDECAYKFSPEPTSMFRKFMKALNPKKVLGFTATPIYLRQGGNMSDSYSILKMMTTTSPRYFNKIIHVTPISLMVKEKYWAKLSYEKYDFDEGLLELNSSGSDFDKISISQAIQHNGINNNIYLRIKSLLKQGKKSILVFVDSVETAEKMASLFDNAACVSGSTPTKERSKIVEDFKSGAINIVINHSAFTTGFDHEYLDTVILGRPTNSLVLYYQMVGRLVRNPLFPNQKEGLLIDFCNNVKRFGKIENLNFRDVPGYGWGLFKDDILLTGVRMGNFNVTYESLLSDNEEALDLSTIMPFGKHKGKPLNKLPLGYVSWSLDNMDFKTKELKILRNKFKQIQQNDIHK